MFIVNRRTLLRAMLIFSALFSCQPAAGATARAVLVGIDRYRPATAAEIKAAEPILLRLGMIRPSDPPARRNWDRLYGSVNDIAGISALLVHRYGFDPANVIALEDEQATRQAILDNLRRVFIDEAADGDTLVFYFSGHGSQMRNSLSADKSDKMDETIVPWDANAGYWDIRDKELARIFNEALDKHPHVTITAIFDSCHSGSIARGLSSGQQSRSELPDDRDAKDPYSAPAPETRGALILSAAQFDEAADETDDTTGNPPTTHGVFTLALMQALQTAGATTPAIDIFRATRAKIRALGEEYDQEPVIAGTDRRLDEGMFGAAPIGTTKTFVTILAVYPDTKQFVVDGGYALGLQPGALVESIPTAPNSKPIQLAVQSVDGMSQSTLTPSDPEDFAKLRKGDMLRVSRWAFPGGAKLSVWIPPSNLSFDDITAAAKELSQLARDEHVQWIDDPTEVTPTYLIDWNGKSWELRAPNHVSNLGMKPSVTAVQAALRKDGSPKPRLFVLLPASSDLRSKLAIGAGTENDAVKITEKQEDAQYWLVGSIRSAGYDYAWIRPNSLRGTQSNSPLVIRSDWFAASAEEANDLAASLTTEIMTVGREAGWLHLATPADAQEYPYHLELREASTQKLIARGDLDPSSRGMMVGGNHIRMNEVSDGKNYDLILKADPKAFSDFIPTRKAYVFGIDSDGQSTLLFPKNDADDQTNRLPPDSKPTDGCNPPDSSSLAEQSPYSEICVATIVVQPPLGVDTFFLVTTDQPIGDLSIFRGNPVKSSEARGNNPLADLLLQVAGNEKMRGGVAPENWSIEHVSVLSVPAGRNSGGATAPN